jgi:hypothetical protein
MSNDNGLNEDPEIISSSESENVYDDECNLEGFETVVNSEIFIVELDGDTVFYSKNLGHSRRQAYKLAQNIVFSQPSSHKYYINQSDHNTFIVTAVNKFCLVSYDTPIAHISIRPLYRVKESRQ